MSGTLIDGRLDSAYPTIHVIEPRYYYDHNAFMCQHSVRDEYDHVLFWKNHEKLGRILDRHTVRRTFASVHGVEKPIVQIEYCSLTPKQEQALEGMEEKALLELEDKFLDTSLPCVHSIRARQVMQHPHTFGLMKETELTGKEDALMVHAEDHIRTKKPFVVFSVFMPEQRRIVKLLEEVGLRVALINSDVPPKVRGEIDVGFQAGKYDVLVGSQDTAAVGFNWGHCDHFIFSSMDYKDSSFEQAYKRGIREKRKIPLRVTLLKYLDSPVENRVFQIVIRKNSDKVKVDGSYDTIEFGG